jgi:hypothetical protein
MKRIEKRKISFTTEEQLMTSLVEKWTIKPSLLHRRIKHSCSVHINLAYSKYDAVLALRYVTLIENLSNEMIALKLDCNSTNDIFTNIERGPYFGKLLSTGTSGLTGAFLIDCSHTLLTKPHLNILTLCTCDTYPRFFSEPFPLLLSLGSLHQDTCNFIIKDGQ